MTPVCHLILLMVFVVAGEASRGSATGNWLAKRVYLWDYQGIGQTNILSI